MDQCRPVLRQLSSHALVLPRALSLAAPQVLLPVVAGATPVPLQLQSSASPSAGPRVLCPVLLHSRPERWSQLRPKWLSVSNLSSPSADPSASPSSSPGTAPEYIPASGRALVLLERFSQCCAQPVPQAGSSTPSARPVLFLQPAPACLSSSPSAASASPSASPSSTPAARRVHLQCHSRRFEQSELIADGCTQALVRYGPGASAPVPYAAPVRPSCGPSTAWRWPECISQRFTSFAQ
jgi:hypothetical protein